MKVKKNNTIIITPTNRNRNKQHDEPNRSNCLQLAQSAGRKARIQGAIGFGRFASYWMKNKREIFKPITWRSNCSRVITFDSHLKTALPLS